MLLNWLLNFKFEFDMLGFMTQGIMMNTKQF